MIQFSFYLISAMYLSIFHLQTLKLDRADLEELPENEQIQRIRLQWMNLCMQTNKEEDVDKYLNAYHGLVSPYDATGDSDIHKYYPRNPINVSHVYFNLFQREQIEKSYQELLTEFSQLTTEDEKRNFAQHHSSFLNLAHSMRANRKEFERNFSGYLFLAKKRFKLSYRILYQWRIMIIRLFGVEGLDDFHYRNALATGQLNAILARDKLWSPVKLLIAIVNSVILAISITLNYILDKHWILGIAFSCFLFHPVAIVLTQLPKIAQILEMLACPNNQIIRPLSAYMKCSALKVSALLGLAVIGAAYGLMYTSVFATLVSMLPYLQLLALAYFLYLLFKIFVPHFCQSFERGLIVFSAMIVTFSVMTAIRMFVAQNIGVNVIQSNDTYKEWLSIMGLYSLVSAMSISHNPFEHVEMLPNAHEPVPEDICAIVRTRYNKANLSYRFFSTPKESDALRPEEANQAHCFAW